MPPKTIQNHRKIDPKTHLAKKRDFSKNSTPFEREAQNGGSRAPKTIPKSAAAPRAARRVRYVVIIYVSNLIYLKSPARDPGL